MCSFLLAFNPLTSDDFAQVQKRLADTTCPVGLHDSARWACASERHIVGVREPAYGRCRFRSRHLGNPGENATRRR
jgi:hypothetical protein